MGNKLNENELMFCDRYLVSRNATRSYMAVYGCGYGTAAVEAHRALKKPKIRAHMRRLHDEWRKRAEIHPADIINNARKVFNKSMADEPVLDKDGNNIGVYRFDSSGANNALQIMGKCIGAFIDMRKIEQDIHVDSVVRHQIQLPEKKAVGAPVDLDKDTNLIEGADRIVIAKDDKNE